MDVPELDLYFTVVLNYLNGLVLMERDAVAKFPLIQGKVILRPFVWPPWATDNGHLLQRNSQFTCNCQFRGSQDNSRALIGLGFVRTFGPL